MSDEKYSQIIDPPIKDNQGTTSSSSSKPNKSPLLAAFISFFLYGGGQFYLGQRKKGISLFLLGWAINFISNFFFGGFIVITIIAMVAVGDAYGIAQKLNNGHSVGEWEFNINWTAAVVMALIYIVFFILVFTCSLGNC